MRWSLYETLFNVVGPPMNRSVDLIASLAANWVGPILTVGLGLYVFLKMVQGALRPGDNPMGDMMTTIIAGGFCVAFASNMAMYGPYIRDIMLNGVSRELGSAFAGTVGSRAVSGALFDESWNRAWAAGLTVYNNLPWSATGLGLTFVVVLYWFVAAFSVAFAFLVWLKAYIFVALLVGLGPLFVGLFVFSATRGWAFGWLNTTASNVLLQIMTTVLLTLLLTAQTLILSDLAASVATRRSNEIAELQMLFGGAIIFFACGWLASQLPGACASITHGFAGFGHLAIGRLGSLPSFGGGGRSGAPPQGVSQPNAYPVTRNTPPAAPASR